MCCFIVISLLLYVNRYLLTLIHSSILTLFCQDGITPLMLTLREPDEEQQEHGVTSQSLTETAHVLINHPQIDVDVTEPVSGWPVYYHQGR